MAFSCQVVLDLEQARVKFAIKYARENNVPYFGICLGMQLATVEFARNVLGLEGAHSENLILAHLIQLLIYCLSKRILKI